MPLIKVYGIPPFKNAGVQEQILKNLCAYIIIAAEGIPELGLIGKKNAITVFFLPDSMMTGLGEEIIAEVEIFAKPERTKSILDLLAQRICEAIERSFPTAEKVECFVHPFCRSTGGFHKIVQIQE